MFLYFPIGPNSHLSPQFEPSLAVVARIYTPNNSKRKSKLHLYFCGLHGEHLQVVPQAVGQIFSVRWTSPQLIRWKTWIGNQVWNYQLNRTLHTTIRMPEGEGAVDFITEDLINEDWPVSSTDVSHPGSFGWSNERASYIYSANGKTKEFHPQAKVTKGYAFSQRTNTLLFRNWTHESTFGSHNDVYMFDWVTGEPRTIFTEMAAYDIQPDRDLYASVETRDLAPISKTRQVWFAKPWVGNWRTGKRWNPIQGLVYAVGIAIRPGVTWPNSKKKMKETVGLRTRNSPQPNGLR